MFEWVISSYLATCFDSWWNIVAAKECQNKIVEPTDHIQDGAFDPG